MQVLGGEALTLVLQKAQGLSRVRTQGESPLQPGRAHSPEPDLLAPGTGAQPPKLQTLASVVSERPACSDLSSGPPFPTLSMHGVYPQSQG